MNTKENGFSDDRKTYYLPASHAQHIRRYRQCSPSGDELLGIEAFDYLVISVLQITGLASPEMEIQAVHVDAAFPLGVTVENTTDLFSKTRYPLRLAYGAALPLLLHVHTASGCFRDLCYPDKPRKVVVTTNHGPLVFEAVA
jgi:hypothetical protein